jgi:hypothetical protein
MTRVIPVASLAGTGTAERVRKPCSCGHRRGAIHERRVLFCARNKSHSLNLAAAYRNVRRDPTKGVISGAPSPR